jgi:hypothetical protein
MIDSYWDLYVAYIDKCLRDNWTEDIDPHHYRMEWNHTLPQCLFGDQSLGHYLTLGQHAIASALQTLAMRKNCMFGWHKRYLPERLVELAWPYFEKQCADNGAKTGPKNFGAMFAALTPEMLSDNGKKASKSVLLTNILTKETLEFPSLSEAARSLGLNRGHLGSVARGEVRQHKGYTAVYL